MSWNKGFTKETHPSIKKISDTMKKKHLDNFKKWRDQMKKEGIIPNGYPLFSPSENLAELTGVVLGDGHIEKFPRTERLYIVGNSNNPGFIKHYSMIIEQLFDKKPRISKIKKANAFRISIYQKEIENRLQIPSGNRGKLNLIIPRWILEKNKYIICLLKGLFEAEGSLSIHLPTCTYNFQFKNSNQSLLNVVLNGLKKLGYHPEVRSNSIRLRKRQEVLEFKNLIQFRQYICGVD